MSALYFPYSAIVYSFSIYRAKRSWFANFRSEREKEEVVVVYRDKSFQDLKSSLLQALRVSHLCKECVVLLYVWNRGGPSTGTVLCNTIMFRDLTLHITPINIIPMTSCHSR